jgi:hypothetical protein
MTNFYVHTPFMEINASKTYKSDAKGLVTDVLDVDKHVFTQMGARETTNIPVSMVHEHKTEEHKTTTQTETKTKKPKKNK